MIQFRLMYDKDKEQNWLNEMVQKGWAMESFFLGFYKFSQCEPNRYIYQVDLLNSWAADHEDYMQFMRESNVEVVSRWFRWVTLRKKAIDGPFELYTDIESRIEQYRRIGKMFTGGAIIEFGCVIAELNAAVSTREPFFIGATVLVFILFIVFVRMVFTCKENIKKLKLK